MMRQVNCWRCLRRPSLLLTHAVDNVPSRLPPVHAFSTTATLSLATKKAAPKNQIRAGKKTKLKKRAVVKTAKPPAPGERKAIRKRIVLSNSNALDVQGLEDISEATLVDEQAVGKVFSLPAAVIDGLRAAEAFKITQSWGMFRKPSILFRSEGLELSKMMDKAQRDKGTTKTILDGARGTGKSMLLLQAMTTALLRGWVVINIPEAQDLTIAGTPYSAIPGTTPPLWSQNVYTAEWLGKIGKANSAVLSKIQLSKKHTLPVQLQDNISLARLAELGSRDPEISWEVFKAFWSELTAAGRPPILLTLDGLSHIMKESAYRDPDFKLIHSHDFAIVKHFLDHLSGTATLPNGGAVIAATSKGNSPTSYALGLAIKNYHERQAGREVTPRDPFTTIDARAFDSLQAAHVIDVKGISRVEAKALMEYWAASGLLRQIVDDRVLTEKLTLSGNGIVGELERGALHMRI